jgi:hypothetical protein
MPRDERVLIVFVASPSDLEPERNRLEEVVRELNLTWSRTLRFRLELVRWETHGYPGVGVDAQEVLNRELDDSPDIFIGLMWGRYGTPTGRAGSGTEEEFARALARYRENQTSVRIMFYFKDAPLSPSDIDPDQLARIQRFKESLGTEGVLHWKFLTVEEFERLLRLHLARQIQEAAASPPEIREVDLAASVAEAQPTPEDDLGLLDYMDLLEEYFGALNEITNRISSETASLGSKMEQRTAEINAATADGQERVGRREARAMIEKAAIDMDQYVARMTADIPLFRDFLRKGADVAARAALISADMNSGDRRQVHELRKALLGFSNALTGAYNSTDSFRASVQRLPRMTIVLNKAKRETAGVLSNVLESIAEGRRVAIETVRTLDTLLGSGEASNAD